MRAIYLMARREYLSYVATWGFWLSLMAMPFIMAIFIGISVLAENAQPTRYYAVLDDTGIGFDARILDALNESAKNEAISALSDDAETAGRSDAIPAIAAAINAEPGLEGWPEAIDALGSPTDHSATEFQSNYVRVDPPARSIEELRPYLLGEQLLQIDGEAHPLFAVVIFRPGGDFGVTAEYWSTNRTSGGLRSSARDSLRDYVRSEALEEAGISESVLDRIHALNPGITENSPERGRTSAEVSFADSLPFIVGIVFSIGLWMMIFSVTNMLLTAMIEEKGNKILETLLATARYHEILIGKLAGLAAVSATFMLVWGGIGSGGLVGAQTIAAAADLPAEAILATVFDPGLLIPAIGYFAIGYLMYGTVYLAIGSLCDTLQEAQSLMSPMILVMMVPFVIIMATIENPDSPFLQYASWVPIWTPFLMMARLQTNPGLIELIGTTIAMVATATAIMALASYVFRQGSMGRANASSIKRLLSFKKAKSA